MGDPTPRIAFYFLKNLIYKLALENSRMTSLVTYAELVPELVYYMSLSLKAALPTCFTYLY